jgi:hypothetical protein
VELQPAIRAGVTASAIAHLSILALVILLSDVHPFHAVTGQTIAVDIVTPQEVPPDKPEPFAPPPPDPSPPQKAPPPSAAPEAAQPAPRQQAALPAPPQNRREAAAPPQPASASPAPGYEPPQPDLTVKYNVMLGLPPELPVAASGSGEKKDGDGYDASASAITANISSSVVAEFRRHLKTCSKLPAAVAPSDHVLVKLRVYMTREGRLSGEPLVGGGSANTKAIELLQSAIDSLKSCQPYAMLPPDRYGEWKALDLVFTPKDFGS